MRDSDSRLNARDRFAVEEWIESKKNIHSIRDHIHHCNPMNGGMWGGTKEAIKVGVLKTQKDPATHVRSYLPACMCVGLCMHICI